jgi:flagellar biosynthesis/type III secretory pathway chaperone
MIKYNISNIEEFDEKIRRGELNETDVFEDFTRLDYLLDREEKLRKLLEELEEKKSERI